MPDTPRREHWSARTPHFTLSDLYDGDARASSPLVGRLARRIDVPHPLTGVAYAEGVYTAPQR